MGKLSCGLTIPGVFEQDGRYYKVVRNKWIKLSRIDEGVNALYRALYELDPARPNTIGELISVYRAAGMDHLRASTRARYLNQLKRLDHHFGKMEMGTLRPSQVAMFLEKRRKRPKGGTAANREFAVLSSVHDFGMRQGWIEANPCRGIRRNPEKPRRRAVTDPEFLEAFQTAPEPFQDLLAAALLSGARLGDLMAWRRSLHLTPSGIHFVESKTGKPHEIAWSDALRFFVRRSMARFPKAEAVFTNRFGRPWTQAAVSTQMTRLKLGWTFRDVRAKAQTDSPHSVLGHGAAMEAVYRKVIRTRPVR